MLLHVKRIVPPTSPFARSDFIRVPWPVVGLEEGALVRVENGVVTARGTARVKIFRRGQPPTWHEPGERLALEA